MKKQMLLGIGFVLGLSSALFAQSVQANYALNYVTVHYTYEVRELDSPEDSIATYAVTASWPSSANPVYTHTLKSYEIGDTIATTLVPLVTPELLAAFGYILTGDPNAPGVALDIDLSDDGSFTINDGSTYPTTATINCSTTAVIPNVAENGTWSNTTGYTNLDDPNKYTMGWGITLSSVFAQFNAADLINGVYGVDYGPNTPMENWGMMEIEYNDADHSTPQNLDIHWEAHDGVGSGLGVDSDGKLNGHTGIPVLAADTTTIPYIATLNPNIHVSTNYGMLGGTGIPTDSLDPMTGEYYHIGVFKANYGYLFDPLGGDGVPFSGDEALQFTGYYFTKNFLTAAGTFEAVATPIIGADPTDYLNAFTQAATAIAYTFAATAADSGAAPTIGEGVGSNMAALVAPDLSNLGAVSESGPTQSLGGITNAFAGGMFSVDVNDSDHDMMLDGTTANGRLIYEVDNVCIPDNTTQRVNPKFYNTNVNSVVEAPIAEEFKLQGNYPNPFNPTTKIRFSTERFSDVTVTIYSLLGKKVATIHRGKLIASTYDITWTGKDNNGNLVPSGVYFYEVKSDNRSLRGKMLLLK